MSIPVNGPSELVVPTDETKSLFAAFRHGNNSVRNLARLHGIPFETLRDRFRRSYGGNYRLYRGGEGTLMGVIREHLAKVPDKHRDKVEKWFAQNKAKLQDTVLEDNLSGRTRLFTGARMDRDTRSLCRLDFDLADSPFLTSKADEPQLEDTPN
jgi:hypothetical protein